MMSLIECYKIVPGDIFGISDILLKRIENILNFHLFYLKNRHRHYQMLQFWCIDSSDSEEDK